MWSKCSIPYWMYKKPLLLLLGESRIEKKDRGTAFSAGLDKCRSTEMTQKCWGVIFPMHFTSQKSALPFDAMRPPPLMFLFCSISKTRNFTLVSAAMVNSLSWLWAKLLWSYWNSPITENKISDWWLYRHEGGSFEIDSLAWFAAAIE